MVLLWAVDTFVVVADIIGGEIVVPLFRLYILAAGIGSSGGPYRSKRVRKSVMSKSPLTSSCSAIFMIRGICVSLTFTSPVYIYSMRAFISNG